MICNPVHLGEQTPVHLDEQTPLKISFKNNTEILSSSMIYREQPGRAVSGEAAPGEQAPTGADWPGFFPASEVSTLAYGH